MDVNQWRGIRFADTDHRFAPPQLRPIEAAPEAGGVFGDAPWQPVVDGFDLRAPMGENCLSVNIWAPDGASDLPVLLWFFGGGFEMGAASAEFFDGRELAGNVPCVVVTANYRLGFIGFGMLAHHGGRLAQANNLGVRDAQTAIRWVSQHIGMFGGDPQKITVAGQSAGGFLSCAALVALGTPTVAAAGFFSGGASRIVATETAAELGDALLARLGISDDPERVIDVPAAEILAAQSDLVPRDLGVRNGAEPRALGVVLDADCSDPVVPMHPMDAVLSGRLANSALLSAATMDECWGFESTTVSAVDMTAVEAELGSFAGEAELVPLLEAYGVSESGSEAGATRRRVLSDYIYRLPAARLISAQQQAGGRGALVDFPRESADPAPHGAELGALFGRSEDTSHRATAMRGIYEELISAQSLPDGGLDDPLVQGDVYPADVTPPSQLLALWEGASRP